MREEIRAIEGLDVLDERLAGRPGVFAYDPLRLAVDVRGLAASGYELAPLLREIDDINLELYGQNVLVAVFGMGERRLPEADAARGGAARRRRARRPDPARARGELRGRAAVGRAGDDPARGLPRRARRSCRRSEAVGRIAAESLATYPPGIPNVLPGERLTAETLAYIRRTLELGGSVRGASDRLLRTVRGGRSRVRGRLGAGGRGAARSARASRAARRRAQPAANSSARAAPSALGLATCASIRAGAPGPSRSSSSATYSGICIHSSASAPSTSRWNWSA